MAQSNDDKLLSNPIETQGLLIKHIYKKFGKEALGLKIKKKLPNNNLTTVAKAFSKSFNQNFVKVISISDEKFQIHGTKCPFELENTFRELCEVVMTIDHEYFREAVNKKIELKIIKTIAAGDPYCDTIYEIQR